MIENNLNLICDRHLIPTLETITGLSIFEIKNYFYCPECFSEDREKFFSEVKRGFNLS